MDKKTLCTKLKTDHTWLIPGSANRSKEYIKIQGREFLHGDYLAAFTKHTFINFIRDQLRLPVRRPLKLERSFSSGGVVVSQWKQQQQSLRLLTTPLVSQQLFSVKDVLSFVRGSSFRGFVQRSF